MYKYVSNNKVVWSYMDFLVIDNGELTLYWENNTSYISVFAAKRVTPRVKNIDIPVCFLQKQYGNGVKCDRIFTLQHTTTPRRV